MQVQGYCRYVCYKSLYVTEKGKYNAYTGQGAWAWGIVQYIMESFGWCGYLNTVRCSNYICQKKSV